MKAERGAAAGQQVAELVDPGRGLVPDHGHQNPLGRPALLAPPLLQRLGDHSVELLIR